MRPSLVPCVQYHFYICTVPSTYVQTRMRMEWGGGRKHVNQFCPKQISFGFVFCYSCNYYLASKLVPSLCELVAYSRTAGAGTNNTSIRL